MDLIHPTLPNQHPRLKFKFKAGWSQRILFTSDEHADSPESVLDILLDHYREAKETGAYIVSAGDFFDVINSREDERRSMSTVRDEHKVDAYVDAVLEFGLKTFGKFADQFIYFGTGNHESKLMKLTGSDITARFVDELNRLRSPGLPPIYRAGYGGWLRCQFERGADRVLGGRQSCNIKIFHGAGGASPVTKGTMEVQRMASYIDGADVVVTGHNHHSWQIPHMFESINNSGIAYMKPRKHLKLAGYKVDYRLDGSGTWSMQGGNGPRPIGGAWLTFTADGDRVTWETQETKVDYSKVA